MELNEEQMSTVRDMRAWVKRRVDNKDSTERCAVKHFSRMWSDTCKKLGLKKRKMHNHMSYVICLQVLVLRKP